MATDERISIDDNVGRVQRDRLLALGRRVLDAKVGVELGWIGRAPSAQDYLSLMINVRRGRGLASRDVYVYLDAAGTLTWAPRDPWRASKRYPLQDADALVQIVAAAHASAIKSAKKNAAGIAARQRASRADNDEILAKVRAIASSLKLPYRAVRGATSVKVLVLLDEAAGTVFECTVPHKTAARVLHLLPGTIATLALLHQHGSFVRERLARANARRVRWQRPNGAPLPRRRAR